MEKGGTGGALFRNLYRDFLKESDAILKIESVKEAHLEFAEIAKLWTDLSCLFHKVGETKDRKYIDEASLILKELSEKEKCAMEKLSEI